MSLNFSGGLQNLVNSCHLKVEGKWCEMSKNLTDDTHNWKHGLFHLNQPSQL